MHILGIFSSSINSYLPSFLSVFFVVFYYRNNEIQQNHAAIASLNDENEALRTKIHTLSENDDLDEARRLKASLDETETKVNALTDENRRLYARIEDERNASLEKAEIEKAKYKRLEESRGNEISSLKQMNEVHIQAKFKYENDILELNKSVQIYKDKLEKVNGEVQWLTENQEENKKQSKVLAGSLVTIANRIATMTEHIRMSKHHEINTDGKTETLEKSVEHVARALNVFEVELQLLIVSRDESNKDAEMLKASQSKSQTQYKLLKKTLEQSNKNLTSTTALNRQLESQVESLSYERDELKTEVASLTRELDRSKAEIDTLNRLANQAEAYDKYKDKMLEQKEALAQGQLSLANKIVENEVQRRQEGQESKVCSIL